MNNHAKSVSNKSGQAQAERLVRLCSALLGVARLSGERPRPRAIRLFPPFIGFYRLSVGWEEESVGEMAYRRRSTPSNTGEVRCCAVYTHSILPKLWTANGWAWQPAGISRHFSGNSVGYWRYSRGNSTAIQCGGRGLPKGAGYDVMGGFHV
jgi:hypothetical protein